MADTSYQHPTIKVDPARAAFIAARTADLQAGFDRQVARMAQNAAAVRAQNAVVKAIKVGDTVTCFLGTAKVVRLVQHATDLIAHLSNDVEIPARELKIVGVA